MLEHCTRVNRKEPRFSSLHNLSTTYYGRPDLIVLLSSMYMGCTASIESTLKANPIGGL